MGEAISDADFFDSGLVRLISIFEFRFFFGSTVFSQARWSYSKYTNGICGFMPDLVLLLHLQIGDLIVDTNMQDLFGPE